MIARLLEQHLTSLEPGARQPHLAMMADGSANMKTRERTEDAAIAVQAMHGDSCSADRVDPDPMCSTSFGVDCVGPPAPFCLGENVLVDNRAAAPKSCLPSLEMRSPTAAGGLHPTGEASTAAKTTYNKTPRRLYATEETNPKETNLWTLVPSACTTAVSGEINCLLLPPAGGLWRQNRCKIERSIQVVLKVVSAPVHFWDRGARYFMVRLCVLERQDETAAFFGRDSLAL